MEGETCSTNKLRFIESKRRFKIDQNEPQANCIKHVTAANNHDLVLFAHQQMIAGIQMSGMFDFDRSKKTEIFNTNQFSLTFPLSFKPSMLTVARYGYSSTLLVTGLNPINNVITLEAFDLDSRSSIGKLDLNELGNQNEIIDYSWHPNYFESIVALCTKSGNLLIIAIDKTKRAVSLALNSSNCGALTCAWSPKGKNLAVGKENGSVIRLEPVVDGSTFSFKEVDKSTIIFLPHPRITSAHRVIRLRWLNKTYILCVHAKPGNNPETVHSIITVKPAKPTLFWTNICLENQNMTEYFIHCVNLSNAVICSSCNSGEAAVIGFNGVEEANRSELKDHKNFIIDEEGARVELPLDANNRETYPKGVTATFIRTSPNDQGGKPIIIFLTTDGLLCAYLVDHCENMLRLPEFQKPADCPISIMPQVPALPPLQAAPIQSIPPPPMPQSSFQTHSFGSSGMFGGSSKKEGGPAGFYTPLAGLTTGNTPQSTFGSFGSTTQPVSTFGSLSAAASGSGTPAFGASTFGTTTFGASTFGPTTKQVSFPPVPTSAPAPAATPAPFSAPVFNLSLGSTPSATPTPTSTATTTATPSTPQASTFCPAPLNLSTTPTSSPTRQEAQTITTPSAPVPPPTAALAANPPQPPTLQPLSLTSSSSAPPQPPAAVVVPPSAQVPVASLTPSISVAANPPRSESTEQAHKDMSLIPSEILKMKENIKYNEAFLTLLEEINHLRKQFKEVEETHNIHRECFEAIREDINQLDIGMLENLYLIEYIKSRKRDISRKKSLDPKTLKKVESIKQKSKLLAEKLTDLNVHVDVSWEDFVRRRSATESRDKKISSLDIIYQTLATNQRIITALQRKVAPMQAAIETTSPSSSSNKRSSKSEAANNSTSNSFIEAHCDGISNRRDIAPAKIRAFRNYLASRNSVPVRRPEVSVGGGGSEGSRQNRRQ